MLLVMMLLAALHVSAAVPNILYANKDEVKVYKEQDKESQVLKTLKGGEKVLVEQATQDEKWAAVLCPGEGGEGQQLGWFLVENMADKMPQQYCAHEWSDWEITEEATCTQSGMQMRTCQICGAAEAVDTDLKPHTFGEWKVTKEATCKEEGERVSTCTVCGTEEKQVIEKLPHTFGEWKVTKEATCKEEGERVHTCSVCNTEEKQVIEKLPHEFETKILTEATDHSAGVKQNVCKKCGFAQDKVSFDPEGTLRRGAQGEAVRQMQQLLADQNYLNADGADGVFGGGTEVALMKFQQANGLTPDGVAWPQTLKRLQHEFGEWKVTSPLTRTKAGERTRVCKDCGFEQHETIELSPMLVYGQRGDDVRTVQQMLTDLGFDAGTCDGIYGQKLDAAFGEFAKAQKEAEEKAKAEAAAQAGAQDAAAGTADAQAGEGGAVDAGQAQEEGMPEFVAGQILPAQIDALVNAWIASAPAEAWMGKGAPESPVDLALTITPSQNAAAELQDGIVTYTWSLTNLGAENCYFTTLLLNFGEKEDADAASADTAAAEGTVVDGVEVTSEAGAAQEAEKKEPDFRKDNIVVVLDGAELKANGGNSVSGSFKVSKDWGGDIQKVFFSALGASETTGAKWLSNVQ